MTLMNTPADRELNKRLIDISKALTTLLCGTSTVDDSAYIRERRFAPLRSNRSWLG